MVPSDRMRALAAVCLIAGIALLALGAVAAWAGPGGSKPVPAAQRRYERARDVWRTAPVDRLLPPVLPAPSSGPDGLDRTWTRIRLAPASTRCSQALTPALARRLAPLGCARILRAVYTDATRSQLVGVGVLAGTAGPAAARRTARAWAQLPAGERTALRPHAVGTPDSATAAWAVRVETGAPRALWTTAAFADRRRVDHPLPAAAAGLPAHAAPVESGLTTAAKDVLGRIAHAWNTPG